MMTLQCVNIIAVFLFCQQAFVESEVEECSGEAEYSIFGMMLRRHIFKKIPGAPLGDVCLRECYRDVRCQSFNYVISKETCELNNRTKEARPEDFVPNSDRYYFKRDKNRVRLGSIPELPAESCKEIKTSEGEWADNGNYWLHFLEIEEILLSYCDMKTEECQKYQSLPGAGRKTNHSTAMLCDSGLRGWYRFQGAAGTRMPTTCPYTHKCNTAAPGWLNGAHPTVAEGKVTRQVCFHWLSNCCHWRRSIKVRNCGSFYVFYFNSTPSCHLRYCGTH